MTAFEFNNQLLGLRKAMEYFALSLTRDWEDAEDLTQETCLKALQYKEHYRSNVNFKAWVLTIMKNTFINNYNRKARYSAFVDKTDINSMIVSSKIDEHTSPETQLNYKEITEKIDDLKDEYRAAFQMHLNGYKYQEIAEHFNIPIGTVKSRIFLAKKSLMEVFKDSREF